MSSSGITCSACLTGAIKPGTPTGTVTTVYGRPTYIARPDLKKDGQGEGEGQKAKGVIVFITDIFGWEIPNSRLLADTYAREGGYIVLLPDFMDGTAPPSWTMHTMDLLLGPSPSIWTTIFKKPIWAIQIISRAIPFILRNKEATVLPKVLDFHRKLRTTPSPDVEGLKIGSAGFCWGGKYTILLTHPENGGLIDAGFTAHPSKMKFPDEWEKVSKPLSVAIGDVDLGIKIEEVRQIKGVLEKKEDGMNEVVIYEGAKHGFAVRADPADEGQTKSADEAKGQALRWFGKWLF